MPTITELAEEVGVRSDTLRFYERSGLITSAGRTPGGYRLYERGVADRVRFIKAAQRSGLRLRSIAELLAVMDTGDCPCGHTAGLVERRIAEVDDEIGRLRRLKSSLARLQRTNQDCAASTAEAWSCQITLEGGDAR